MYRDIEELRSMAESMNISLETLLYEMLIDAVKTIEEAQIYNRELVNLYKDEVGFEKSNAETNLIILKEDEMMKTLEVINND